MTAPVQTVAPWATETNVDPATKSRLDEAALAVLPTMLQAASDVLYRFSGMQWPGVTTDTIRPVCPCGGRTDPCCGPSQVTLPGYPVIDVTSVTVDGDAVDAAFYRVDNYRWLVYEPGATDPLQGGWPCVQDLREPTTADHTWRVVYRWGGEPPAIGSHYAAVLAGQMALATMPGPPTGCRLPSRVTSITRAGVSIALLDPLTLFEDGRTGLTEIDMWLGSIRYARKHRPAAILNPGARPPRRATAP